MRRNFHSNLNLMWGFLLRSGDLRSNLSLMLWFFFDFCLDLVIFAQIWAWCGDFELDPVIQTQTEADQPNRCLPKIEPTRPEVVDGRWRVVKPFTRFSRVGSGLGTNPTWTDPWTTLVSAVSSSIGIVESKNKSFILDLKFLFTIMNFFSKMFPPRLFTVKLIYFIGFPESSYLVLFTISLHDIDIILMFVYFNKVYS